MQYDKDHFLQLLADHRLILFKVANSYCREPADREDLVQEMILQLWKSFPKFDPQYKLSTWVYRIALNVAISYFRRSRTRARHLQPLPDGFLEIAAPSSDPDRNEDLEILQQFIRQLKDFDRALIILYLDGKSQAEISEVLQISRTNVSTKINRIKTHLKNQFKSLNHE